MRLSLLRPAAAVAGIAAGHQLNRPPSPSLCEKPRAVPRDVHSQLELLRPGEEAMRARWVEDEMHWHKLPPRAWPPFQPKADELPTLEARAEACASVETLYSSSTDLSAECMQRHFDVATCLTFNMLDPAEGYKRYSALAARGHIDSAVACGIVLLEGIGRDEPGDAKRGCEEIRRASAAGHAQGQYELGCLHYLGSEPEHVPEDEAAAFGLFEAAANQRHTSALFMLAEALVGGLGCDVDPARAIPLLHAAAEQGHRMARQNLVEWLDADRAAYGAGAEHDGGAADPRAAARRSSVQLAQQEAARLPKLPAEGSEHFTCFRGGTGEAVSLEEVVAAAAAHDVVYLGETHDDPIAHHLEVYLLISLAARRVRALSGRRRRRLPRRQRLAQTPRRGTPRRPAPRRAPPTAAVHPRPRLALARAPNPPQPCTLSLA